MRQWVVALVTLAVAGAAGWVVVVASDPRRMPVAAVEVQLPDTAILATLALVLALLLSMMIVPPGWGCGCGSGCGSGWGWAPQKLLILVR